MNMNKIKTLSILAGVSVLIFLVFYPILNSYFVTDDFRLIYISSPLSLNDILDFFTSTGGWFAGFYRPIVRMAFFMDFSLYHLNPVGYHLTNLLFHLSNTIMVFYLAKILTDSVKAGVFATFFFAVQPLHTSVVTWISGRSDLIFTFFYLLAVLSFLKYISYEEKKKIYLIVSILCSVLSLLSKESAITLPIILFFTQLFYRQKEAKDNRYRITLTKYIPFLFIWSFYFLIRLYVIKGGIYEYNIGLDTFLRVSYHFFQLFAPINIDTFNFSDWSQFILNLVMVLNIVILSFLYLYISKDKKRSLPIYIYCATWILITSFPLYFVSGDRFLYISSVASSVLLGFIILKGFEGVKRYNFKAAQIFLVFLVISVLLTFSIRTVRRNHIYHYVGNIAKEIISQIENKYPHFPEGSVLYFINFPYEWINDTETWVKVFSNIKVAIQVKYCDRSLIVHSERKRFLTFEEKLRFLERNFREYMKRAKRYYIFEYQDGSVIETSDMFREKMRL